MSNLAIIAATSNNWVIGCNNQLPWHLPADLHHFKNLTLHKPIIMGRNTWQSLGTALPNRLNIVLSRQNLPITSAVICTDLSSAIAYAQNWIDGQKIPQNTEIMLIGGEQIYKQVLPLAHKIYLTKVLITVQGDAFFPDFSHLNFTLTKSQKFTATDNYPAYIFEEYLRN